MYADRLDEPLTKERKIVNLDGVSGGGAMRRRQTTKRVPRASPYSIRKVPAGDVNSSWEHDLFNPDAEPADDIMDESNGEKFAVKKRIITTKRNRGAPLIITTRRGRAARGGPAAAAAAASGRRGVGAFGSRGGATNGSWNHDMFDVDEDEEQQQTYVTPARRAAQANGQRLVTRNNNTAVAVALPPRRRRQQQQQPAPPVIISGPMTTGVGAVITIENLAQDLTETDLQTVANQFGQNSATLFCDENGKSEGVAEISFMSRSEAIAAQRALDGNELDGDGHVLECYLGGFQEEKPQKAPTTKSQQQRSLRLVHHTSL